MIKDSSIWVSELYWAFIRYFIALPDVESTIVEFVEFKLYETLNGVFTSAAVKFCAEKDLSPFDTKYCPLDGEADEFR